MLPYEIAPTDVSRLRQAGKDFLLLDVRENKERQAAFIEPSLHIPMGDVPHRLQELNPEQLIVVYCHKGVRSLHTTAWLRQHGLEKVQSMSGGIDLWSLQIDTAVPRY